MDANSNDYNSEQNNNNVRMGIDRLRKEIFKMDLDNDELKATREMLGVDKVKEKSNNKTKIMKLKEKIKNSEKLYDENINMFDYIYFIPTRRKHDSGYYIFEMYGCIYDKEKHEEKYYCLGTYTDVIDFEKISCTYDRAVSIDMPEYNVFRLFTRYDYKFLIPFFHCSSFIIEIRKNL